MHRAAVVRDNQTAATHSRRQLANTEAACCHNRRRLHEADSLLHHFLVHRAAEENRLIALLCENIGHLRKALRRPALGDNGTADVEAYKLIRSKDAMLTPELLGMLLIFLTRENLQTVMLKLLHTQLRQHVKIHICSVDFAVQRREHIPQRFKQGMRRAAAQFRLGQRINKAAALIRMQINQNVEVQLAQAAGTGHERQKAVVLALLVNRDDLVQIRIMQHHILQLLVRQKGNVRIRRRLAQRMDKGRSQRQVTQMHQKCYQYFFTI